MTLYPLHPVTGREKTYKEGGGKIIKRGRIEKNNKRRKEREEPFVLNHFTRRNRHKNGPSADEGRKGKSPVTARFDAFRTQKPGNYETCPA